jgi:hypothetical protein
MLEKAQKTMPTQPKNLMSAPTTLFKSRISFLALPLSFLHLLHRLRRHRCNYRHSTMRASLPFFLHLRSRGHCQRAATISHGSRRRHHLCHLPQGCSSAFQVTCSNFFHLTLDLHKGFTRLRGWMHTIFRLFTLLDNIAGNCCPFNQPLNLNVALNN